VKRQWAELQRKWCRDEWPDHSHNYVWLLFRVFPGGRTQGSIGHNTALGGAVKLAGYSAHPQTCQLTPGFSANNKKHTPQNSHIYRNSCGFAARRRGHCEKGEYRISVWKSITMQSTHTQSYVRDIKLAWKIYIATVHQNMAFLNCFISTRNTRTWKVFV
jgi:hypothetical protein